MTNEQAKKAAQEWDALINCAQFAEYDYVAESATELIAWRDHNGLKPDNVPQEVWDRLDHLVVLSKVLHKEITGD